ncbi:MAG: P-II family nitrogen regulator [Gemmobacter sp.]|jgi:nitrogen regulatory protein PII
MQTHPASRVEIIIEAVMERRLADLLLGAGVKGFTILPVGGGSGRSGHWSRDGQPGRAGGMVAFVCLCRPERVDQLLEAIMPVLARHIGVVNVTEARVLRAELF